MFGSSVVDTKFHCSFKDAVGSFVFGGVGSKFLYDQEMACSLVSI